MRAKLMMSVLVCGTLIGCSSTSKQDKTTLELADPRDKLETASKSEEPGISGNSTGIDKEALTGSAKSAGAADLENRNVVAAYKPPAMGTVFTWRNNWANLPQKISYKVTGIVKAGKSQYLKMTSVEGLNTTTHAFYDTRNFGLKGYRDDKDRAVVTYKPIEERYRFPMQPGDQWITAWKSIEHKSEKVVKGGGLVQVIGFENLKLPAGTFRTVKVRLPLQRGAPKGMRHYVWFAPELGVTVKEEIGGGSMNWTQILEKVQKPG